MAHSEKYEMILIKKRMQQSFRRLMLGKCPGWHVRKYLGDEVWIVRQWIEKKWLPEMNWDNYGTLWVLDHIVPLRMFNLKDESDLKIVWHYKNIMPLMSMDNLYKEGDLRFSILILDRLPDCPVVRELRRRASVGVQVLDKYLMS